MKKVLAWAVVLALVLSSFTMAFAGQAKTSSDFSDASEINYTEAVDVMVATGIINGFPDGTFGPQKTVQRGQMAKMIACIMNGGEDIGDQYKSACPFADSKDHWAAGYIAYCASEHIIDGRSADVFDPNADVTGTEVAKMALTSLGYDSKIQGYTGETWAAAVLKDAKKNNLFDGLDKSFVAGDPCPREAAAQILFNMLKANEVQYNNNMSVSTGDTTIEVSSKAVPVANNDRDSDNGDGIMQLYEDVFGGKLVLTPKYNGQPAVTDEYGNPGHNWTYDKDNIGTYTDTPAYEFVVEKVEGQTNQAKVLAAFKAFDEDAAEKAVIASVTVNKDSEVAVGLGDSVKLYELQGATEEATPYRAVVEHYEAFKIVNVNTNVKSADAKKDVKAYIYFDTAKPADATYYKDTEIAGYDESTYVKDAIIALALDKDGKIINSFPMEELASGKVTATEAAAAGEVPAIKNATIDGKDYAMATAYKAYDGDLTPGNEYTLYDYNGFALASAQTAEAEANVFYGILLASGQEAGTFSSTDVVKIFTAEGKEEVLEYSKDAGFNSLGKAKFVDADGTDDILIAYTVDEDGVIDSFNKYGETAITAKDITGPKLKTNDVLDGKFVAEDVVVFWNEAEKEYAPGSTTEYTQDSKYVILGLSDLRDADKIAGKQITNKDDDTIVAINLSESLAGKTDSILGFVTDISEKNTEDGAVATVTALVDGAEVTYTSVAKYTFKAAAQDAKANKALVEFVLDGDKKLTNVVAAIPADQQDVTGLDQFTGKAVKMTGPVIDKKNNALALDENKNYQPVAGAYVYFVGEDGLEISSYDAIRATSDFIGTTATLYQIEKDSDNWHIVVFAETEKTPTEPTPLDPGL